MGGGSTSRAALFAALTALTVVAAPTAAEAQFFVQTETSSTFVPLANLPGATQITDFAFSSRDEGRATLTLPFPFRYLGAPYTDVEVGVNGLLVFGGGYFGGYTNYPPGDYWSPNNSIMVWWDDLILPNAAGHASHGVLGAAPDRIFVIEVRDWEHFPLGNLNDGRYQVWLYEGPLGRFEVRYDRLITDTEDYSATAGWEGDQGDGEPNGTFRPCSAASPYCTAADYASLSGRVFRVEQAQGPELLGSVGDFGRGALPGQSLSIPVSVVNQGTEDASGVTSELYLSTDPTLDAADARIATFAVPSVAAGGATVQANVPATVPAAIAPGDYYLLLSVDAPDDHAEPSEQNNVVVAATRFATAYELSLTDVVVPTGARPGQQMQVAATIENLGVPFAGPLTVALRASVDRILDPRDPDLGRITLTPTGVPAEQLSTTITLPLTLPAGGFYLHATLDPDGDLVQIDRTDDARLSAAPFPTAANLVPTAVTGPPGAEPGQPIAFDVTIENRGLDHAGPVVVRAIASPDPIYDLNDVVLGQVSVGLTLGTGQAQSVPVTATVPALPAGNYYPILLVDPGRLVPEVSDFDNNRVGDTTFATGADFAVLDVAGPDEAAAGETVTFTVDVGSIGASYPGTVDFALFLSTDDVFDPADVFMGGGMAAIAGQAAVSQDVVVAFPAVPPGDYRIFAQVDALGAVLEADENNNVYLDARDISTGPDFYIFGVDPSPRTVTPADTVTVTANFRNYGTPYSGPVEYHVYLSVDRFLDPGDTRVEEGVFTLAGESFLNFSTTFGLDDAGIEVPPGEYEVIVSIDPRDLVPEQDGYANEDDGVTLTIEGPNPTVAAIDGAPIAFLGQPYTVSIDVENTGPVDATGFDVAIYLSDVGVLLEGVELGRTSTLSVAAGATRTVTTTVTIPSTTPGGQHLLGAVVDLDRRLLETDEQDNLRLLVGGVTVMPPSADLTGRVVATATAAASGEPLAITRLVQNLADEPAAPAAIAYVLSVDDVLGPEDVVIGTSSVALGAGEDDYRIDVVELPGGIAPGDYRVGLIVDPDGRVPEVDETNNRSLGPVVRVHAPGLRILNERLPTAVLDTPYTVPLFAAGATQELGWSIVSGALPDGVLLDQVSGELRGTPRVEGRFTFTVQVRSGGPTARRTFELVVRGSTVPVDVAAQTLPAAVLARAYEARVYAVGGLQPYRFRAVGPMPLGLSLEPDGRITGVPQLPGAFTIRVRVDDALGDSGAEALVLRVLRADHQVRITQSPLPTAHVGDEYCDPQPVQLFASGGMPDYRWVVDGAPPAGLSLDETGRLCGVPDQAGAFPFSVRVSDAAGSVDTSQFVVHVAPADGFVIRTTGLPDAPLAAAYEARLEVAGGTEPLAWAIELGALPPGLELDASGRIFGTPTEPGRWAFAVRVMDGRGQARRQPLSVRVVDDAAVEAEGGCRCLAPAPTTGAPWWLALGGLALLRRRATRRRGCR